MAKGDIDKQNALLIASCALPHCAAQFKEDSPEYDVWHDVEKLGASDEYAEYRTQLQDKARELALSDAEFEENIHLLFDYDTADYLSDKSKKHDIPVRAEGLLQAAGGTAAMVAGVGACETGAACVVGGYLWVTGSDNLIAGVNQIISGTPTKTVGASILESISVPAEYSELVYAGFDVATGMTSVIVKSIKTGQMRQVVLTQNGKTTQIVGNALKDFAASKQGSIKIPGTGAGKGTTGTNVIAQEGAGLVGKRDIQPNSTVKLTESTKLPNGEVIPKGSTVTVSDNTMKVTYPDGTSKISNYDKAMSSPSALPDLTNAGKGTGASKPLNKTSLEKQHGKGNVEQGGGNYKETKDKILDNQATNQKANESSNFGGHVKNENQLTENWNNTNQAHNASNKQKLKEDLSNENLQNIAKKDPRLNAVVNGHNGKLNYGIGSGTTAEANELGMQWVGEGAKQTSNGGWISADGTRGYRPPSSKDSPFATTGTQANFETYKFDVDGNRIKVGNGHLNIKD